jgi:hypothetical protein
MLCSNISARPSHFVSVVRSDSRRIAPGGFGPIDWFGQLNLTSETPRGARRKASTWPPAAAAVCRKSLTWNRFADADPGACIITF